MVEQESTLERSVREGAKFFEISKEFGTSEIINVTAPSAQECIKRTSKSTGAQAKFL